jgi:hypothetical protein
MAKIVVGEVRFSYVSLFKPRQPLGDGDPKYQTTVLVPKTNTKAIALIQGAIREATEEGIKSKWGGIKPPVLSNPVHDGDGARPSDGMPYGEECAGHLVFTASSKDPIGILDKNKMPIINQSDVYSGMYGYVSLSFYPYNQSGKKGIGCGLNNVMKTRDGDALGGRSSATSDFANIEIEGDTAPWDIVIDPITGMPM